MPRELLSGLLFLLFGAGLVWQSQAYAMGTLTRMGPGYFPTLVGIGIIGVGLTLMAQGLIAAGPRVPLVALRPLVFLLAGIVAFALALDRFGLIIATVVLILIARFASSTPLGWIATVVLAAALAAIGALVFRELLGLPLRLWP